MACGLAFALAACSGSTANSTIDGAAIDSALGRALVGDWLKTAAEPLALRFLSDGTLHAATTPAGLDGEPLWVATWAPTAGDSRLLMVTTAGLCSSPSAKATALYDAAIDASALTLSFVSDGCAERIALLPGVFTGSEP
jgi:hypothetical protein